MKLTIAAMFVVLFAAETSFAVPNVVNSSTYGLRLFEGGPFSFSFNQVLTFDGLPEALPLNGGGVLTVIESETDLGNGLSRIDIIGQGDADIFPADTSAGFHNIGSDSIDFVHDVTLISASLRNVAVTGQNFFNPNMLNSVANPDPWDGTFTATNSGIGFGVTQGLDIRRIELSFVVQQIIPEPTTATLGLIGLAGLLVRRRRAA